MSSSTISNILEDNGFQKIKNQLPGRGDVYRNREGFVATVFDNDTLSISSPFVKESSGEMKPCKDFDIVQRQEDLKSNDEVAIGFDGVVNAEMNISSGSVEERFETSEAFVRNSYAFFDNMKDCTEI